VFFKSAVRPYLILDAPGHIEFLKNMITGAARAEAALLVIDAPKASGKLRRHGYMVSMLGVRQLAVVVNKMDLVDWDRAVYERIVREYGAFLQQVASGPPASSRCRGAAATTSPTARRTFPVRWPHRARRRSMRSTASRRPSTSRSVCRQDVYKFTKTGHTERLVDGRRLAVERIERVEHGGAIVPGKVRRAVAMLSPPRPNRDEAEGRMPTCWRNARTPHDPLVNSASQSTRSILFTTTASWRTPSIDHHVAVRRDFPGRLRRRR